MEGPPYVAGRSAAFENGSLNFRCGMQARSSHRQRRVGVGRRGKHRRPQQEQVRVVVTAAMGVDDRKAWAIAHCAGSDDVADALNSRSSSNLRQLKKAKQE